MSMTKDNMKKFFAHLMKASMISNVRWGLSRSYKLKHRASSDSQEIYSDSSGLSPGRSSSQIL